MIEEKNSKFSITRLKKNFSTPGLNTFFAFYAMTLQNLYRRFPWFSAYDPTDPKDAGSNSCGLISLGKIGLLHNLLIKNEW